MRVTALLLVTIAAVLVAFSGAKVADANHGYIMPWETFQPRGWEKLHDTNQILKNKCRPTFKSMEEFAGKPLSNVLPTWRHVKLDRLRAKRERKKNLSSLCGPDYMAWYYSSGAKCVHEGEGAWNSNTGNGYYGGFQADISFQKTYNQHAYRTWGTANNWSPLEQIKMAYIGWRSRGWYPWPTTARNCGLI